jgi:hypothetical protein
MSADILGDIQGVCRAEAAGKQPAPAYRRTPGIQDFIQYAFNFSNVTLNMQRHNTPPGSYNRQPACL